MRRPKVILGVAVFVALALAVPAAAVQSPPGEAFAFPWHANPITCDGAIGAVPAGSVDIYPVRGVSGAPFWATPAGATTGPWAFALMLSYHVDVFELVDGGPGVWLYDYGMTRGESTGLRPSVTCHNGGPFEFEPDVPVWVEFQTDVVLIR